MKRTILILTVIIFIASFLRLYKLDQNPPSLYWDEASLGYNAFATATTGHDEHGEYLPLARFIAFGDYKPPGYIYTLVPYIKILGLTEFAVRLPSALSGIALVLLTFFLVKELFKNEQVGLIAAFVMAISPWSIQLSRAAFEAHLAALFHMLAIYLFLRARKRNWLFLVSFIMFVLSFYTFNANRILAPLFIVFLSLLFFKEVKQAWKWMVVSVVISAILLIPSVNYLQSRESRLRFQEVSIFTSLETVEKANQRIEQAGNTLLAKIIYNRRVYFARDFLMHYFDHFEGVYLFVHGDQNPRLSIQDVGELYIAELPFLIIGLFFLLIRPNKSAALIFGWLLLAPIPAATARETPHMLRTASMLPTLQIMVGFGLWQFWLFIRKKPQLLKAFGILFVSLLYFGNFYYYQHNFWIHYPQNYSGEWQYGYKQMVEQVNMQEANYDHVYVTPLYGRPYIYFLFYNRINPLDYVAIRQAERDWYGLWYVNGFGKYIFNNESEFLGRILYVEGRGAFNETQKITEVNNLAGDTVFEIGEK
ncbi:phospholipid carrier-dependent glycosyltransferase [Candidatus Microgenomates bacterium]|nr:MAG: phospholipid carrier-dependent glycosyltransferase [Candidatus Microgenomates bacterium]